MIMRFDYTQEDLNPTEAGFLEFLFSMARFTSVNKFNTEEN